MRYLAIVIAVVVGFAGVAIFSDREPVGTGNGRTVLAQGNNGGGIPEQLAAVEEEVEVIQEDVVALDEGLTEVEENVTTITQQVTVLETVTVDASAQILALISDLQTAVDDIQDLETATDTLETATDNFVQVPIGTILDFHDFDLELSLPNGFEVCDGSEIVDVDSPLAGLFKPDFEGVFALGTSVEGTSGFSGGSATHSHPKPNATGSITPFVNHPGYHAYAVLDDFQGWKTSNYLETNSHSSGREGQHRHTLSGSTLHSSSYPPYIRTLKIIRVK